MKNIYENRKRTFFEAITHIPIWWNVHCFMISRSRDHEKRYHGDSTRYFFFFYELQVISRISRSFWMIKCKFLSMRKATFKSHYQKIYIANIYLLYIAKKEREKNNNICQVSKNCFEMFWIILIAILKSWKFETIYISRHFYLILFNYFFRLQKLWT